MRLYIHKFYTSREKNALKNLFLQKVISVINSELELLETRLSHPERFIVKPSFKSNLYIAPKSKDLGIAAMAEIVVALSLLEEIFWSNGKPASLIQIANAFEQMFNFRFGSMYKKQITLFDRKTCNLTKLLDSLRNLFHKESRRKDNEKEWFFI